MNANEMAVALSLRWCIHGRTAPAALAMVRAAGFSHVELCGMDRDCARWWLRAQSRLDLRAVSIHAPCPDEVRDGRRYPGDWLLHEDQHLHAAALQFGRETVRFARRAGVPQVVFHLGSYGLRAEYDALLAAVASGDALERRRCRDAYVRAVSAESTRRRDRLMGVVECLLSEADGEVNICLENRYRLDQVPNLHDIVYLLDAFGGGGLAYWHDTGHEAAQRHLGVWDDETYEQACRSLAGVHLHDCVGTEDHLPPGEGSYDFRPVLGRCHPGMPLVLEITPAASRERVQAARAHLGRLMVALRDSGGDR